MNDEDMEKHRSIEDFLSDDSFHRLCTNNNEQDQLHWKEYLLKYPEDIELFNLAKKEWRIINRAIALLEAENGLKRLRREIRSKKSKRIKLWRYAAAASLVFGLLIGLKLYLQKQDNPAQHIYLTDIAAQRNILLPDGTKIILNAESKIELEKGFGSKNRTIALTGEAYLDVAHNKDLPFIIATPTIKVKVLGTKLNIKAYQNDLFTTTSLLEGSAEVIFPEKNNKSIRMVPSQKVIVLNSKQEVDDAINKDILKNKFLVSSIQYNPKDSAIAETSWTTKKLIFVNETFESLAKTLERWYDVNIFIHGALKSRVYTATFDNNESLENILKTLQLSMPFKYNQEGKTINIYLD